MQKATLSSGVKPLAPSQYYTRLTQRLISAFTAPTAEGILYPVDMRLRPSGQKGPVATQLSSFIHYQESEAWTWEHMALTRARVDLGAAGAARRRREGHPRCSPEAARPGKDRRRRARHARAHREGEGDARSLGAQAGARRPGRPGVHRPASATRAWLRPPAHPEPEHGGGVREPGPSRRPRAGGRRRAAPGRPPVQQSDAGLAALPR